METGEETQTKSTADTHSAKQEAAQPQTLVNTVIIHLLLPTPEKIKVEYHTGPAQLKMILGSCGAGKLRSQMHADMEAACTS